MEALRSDEQNRGPVLSVQHISKSFPGVKALDDVSLELKPGEVLALVGENGAGKSTLINIITGVLKPDEGMIQIGGKSVLLSSPRQAFDEGIAVVHQERNLIPTFTVAENICFDEISAHDRRPVNRREMRKRAASALEHVNLNLAPDSSVEFLSSAQEQLIEIARALVMDAKVCVLDEPTASISSKEVDLLLTTVRMLKAKGVSVIYVSHKLEEVFAIADRIMVLRDGRVAGENLVPASTTREELIVCMVGRKENRSVFALRDCSENQIVLEAHSISSSRNRHENSFQLRQGEVLGWYGLVGSGRTELAREIIGVDPIKQGTLTVRGARASIRSVADAVRKYGIYYISENRKEEGLFLMHSIAANIGIASLDRIRSRSGVISYRKERELAEKYRKELDIRMPSIGQIANSLSGGNQQKVCIAKCLVASPEIVIVDEPTVGIDVNAKGEIHRLIYELAGSAKSIILISSDLPEVVRLADRVLVFRDGSICGELKNNKDYVRMSSLIMGLIVESAKSPGALHGA